MRIYQSAMEAVSEIERDLWEMGHKVSTKTFQDKNIEGVEDYETKEIIAYSFTLKDGRDWRGTFNALGMQNENLECENYVKAEAMARFNASEACESFPRNHSAINPGTSYLHRIDVWKKFLNANGQFSYTYPGRIGFKFRFLKELHSKDNYSRQLVVPIYDAYHDDLARGGKARVPCTMHYQLLHRGDNLYLIHDMRSCDLYTHFAIDMSVSWLLAERFAEEFKAPCPHLVMQVASLHGFKKDMAKRGIF